MKFVATMSKPDRFRDFIKTLEVAYKSSAAQSGRTSRTLCNVELSGAGQIRLSNREKGLSGSEIWCTLYTPGLFQQFSVSSMNNNRIFITVDLTDLLKAFRGDLGGSTFKLKLKKKNQKPCLAIEVRTIVPTPVTLVHDIPVTPISVPEAQDVTEPDVPMPKVQLTLPVIKVMTGVIDRLKSMSDTCTIYGDMGKWGA
mmetsp:Transcript_15763/g.40037  ORF Transcript_15763/g.40037 Transcript_15763/m.40037 type:complete len:198 (-) Transcript_15763:59-652(-)